MHSGSDSTRPIPHGDQAASLPSGAIRIAPGERPTSRGVELGSAQHGVRLRSHLSGDNIRIGAARMLAGAGVRLRRGQRTWILDWAALVITLEASDSPCST